MRALYEIDIDIESCFDQETGEIFDSEKLEALQIERDKKIENVALYVKNLSAEADMVKAEEQNLKERRQRIEKKVEGLKNYLSYALNGSKFETARTALSFRKSIAVNILDEGLLPQEFVKVKTEYSPDKTAIKEAIKGGADVPGAELVENYNLQIK